MAARIAHDDIAAQLALIAQIRSEPYHGTRRLLPRIRRPRPLPLPPTGLLFASLPEMRRPPRPWELPPAIEAALPPAPWAMSDEETAEVERIAATSWMTTPSAAADRRRFDIWIADGQDETQERIDRDGEIAWIATRKTRLGWNAVVTFAIGSIGVGPGNTLRPDIDDEGKFLWSTREAAIAYSAHKIWKMFSADDGSTGRKRKQQDKIAGRIEAFFRAQGIDATRPPDRELKRVLITRARERELRLAAEAAAKAVKAVPAVEPDDGMPSDNKLGRYLFRIGAIKPPSPLALKRRRLKEEREAAARAAAEAEARPPKGPSPEDVAYVQAAILDILPKGWPSYAKDVLSIRKDGGVRICRLRLFDDEIGILQLSGQPGAHGYAWKVGEVDKRPFHFDEEAWAWVRVDDDEEVSTGSPQT